MRSCFYISIQLFIAFILIYVNQKTRTFLAVIQSTYLGSVAAVLRDRTLCVA